MPGSSSSSNHDGAELPEKDQPNASSNDLENTDESSSDDDDKDSTIMSSTPAYTDDPFINPSGRSGIGASRPFLLRNGQMTGNYRRRLCYQYEVRFHPAIQNTKLKSTITRRIAEYLNINFFQFGENTGLFSETHLKDIDGRPLQENTSIRFLIKLKKKSPSGATQLLKTVAFFRIKKIHAFGFVRVENHRGFVNGKADKKMIATKMKKNRQMMTERNYRIIGNPIGLIYVASFVLALITIAIEVFFRFGRGK